MGLKRNIVVDSHKFDVVVIGSGLAGILMTIACGQNKLETGLFEKDTPGGSLLKMDKIENILGHQKIAGKELSYSLFTQAKNNQYVKYFYGCICFFQQLENGRYLLATTNNSFWETKAIIIATGSENSFLPKELITNNKKLVINENYETIWKNIYGLGQIVGNKTSDEILQAITVILKNLQKNNIFHK